MSIPTTPSFLVPSEAARRFMDPINLPMVAWDPQFRLVYCNSAYLALRGVPEAEMLGKTMLELFGEEAWTTGEPFLRRAFTGAAVSYDRFPQYLPEPRWKRFQMFPLFSASGEVEFVGSFVTDIHAEMGAQEALRASEQRMVRLSEVVDLPMGRWDKSYRLTFFNKPYLAWSKRTADEMLGKTLGEIFGQEAWFQARRSFLAAFAGETATYERILRLPSGASSWIRVRVFPDVNQDGSVDSVYTIAFDIDGDRRLQEELRDKIRRLDVFTSNIPFPLTYFDHGFIYRFVNRVFAERHYLEAEMVVGQTIADVRGPVAWAQYEPYARAALGGKEVQHERLVTMLDKTQRWTRTSYIPDMDIHGKVLGVYTATIDIHEIKTAQLALQRNAERDALTDLLNRRMTLEVLDAAERSGGAFALLFIDLDGFKQVNDAHSHRAGDALLVHAVRAMQQVLPTDASFGRFGGDEFVALIPLHDAEGQPAEELAQSLAQHVVGAAAQPVAYEGARLRVSASVGIALMPTHALSSRELLRLADEAMYKAKRNGKSRWWMWGGTY
jgi:diguanylate cyclase (GGDEF)-like protein/PAS domain S-box-containing protein